MQETWVQSPGEGNGNPLQYSCLKNSKNRGTWWATVHVIIKNWTRLTLLLSISVTCWNIWRKSNKINSNTQIRTLLVYMFSWHDNKYLKTFIVFKFIWLTLFIWLTIFHFSYTYEIKSIIRCINWSIIEKALDLFLEEHLKWSWKSLLLQKFIVFGPKWFVWWTFEIMRNTQF